MAVDSYKLKLVKKNIQDYSENRTRFLVIGKNEVAKTGKDKSSFLIQTPNKPGSLMSVLKPFDERNINLSKIETRPSRGNINSHDFFIDCEGHIKDQKLQIAINKVIDTGAILRNFGLVRKWSFCFYCHRKAREINCFQKQENRLNNY